MFDPLALEYQLEDDFISLIGDKLTELGNYAASIVERAGKVKTKQTYPAVLVKAENTDDAFHFGAANSGVMQADIMIDVCTYAAEDKDGSVQKKLLSDVRQAILNTGLKANLNTLSNYTYFGVINGPSFPEPGDKLRKQVIQVEVKFSPTKAA